MNKCLYCYQELHKDTGFHKTCSKQFFGTEKPPILSYSLDEMAELANEVIVRSISVPGVQPKLSMSILKEQTESRLTVVGALGGNFIFKPPSKDYIDMPENEHLTMKMAQLFGIEVVPHSLIKLASGELAYITKRIDRTKDGNKIHMLDFYQITEAFDKYKSSLERVGKVISLHTENTLLDALRFFELVVFSFITGNNDMHLKNFSLILNNGNWSLSPAYDLLNVAILNPKDDEEMALSILGKKKRITKQNLINFGLYLDLDKKQINNVFERFFALKQTAINLVNVSFLSELMRKKYIELLNLRYHTLKF